jgi:hypothetical protein
MACSDLRFLQPSAAMKHSRDLFVTEQQIINITFGLLNDSDPNSGSGVVFWAWLSFLCSEMMSSQRTAGRSTRHSKSTTAIVLEDGSVGARVSHAVLHFDDGKVI